MFLLRRQSIESSATNCGTAGCSHHGGWLRPSISCYGAARVFLRSRQWSKGAVVRVWKYESNESALGSWDPAAQKGAKQASPNRSLVNHGGSVDGAHGGGRGDDVKGSIRCCNTGTASVQSECVQLPGKQEDEQ